MDNHSFAFFSSIAVILFFVVPEFQSFPNGAPNVPKVCQDLFPYHSGALAQTTRSPFHIVTNTNNVVVRSPVNISIIARPGVYFKGFIIQARSQIPGVNAKPLGTFSVVNPLHSKTLDCLDLNRSTATHTNPDQKNSTSFVWTPPKKYRGQVIFHATVVQNFRTFWTNISLKLNVDTEGEEQIFVPEQDPLIYSSSEDNCTDGAVFQLNQTLYGECGVTKACFGIPEDCVNTNSCYALVTVKARESVHEFEMVGIKYVAVSISENGNLNKYSLTECMLVNDAVVRLYQLRYESPGHHLRQIPNNQIEVINNSLWNGMVYCKYTLREDIVLNGVHYSFKNKKFFILLGTDHALGSANDINLDSVKYNVSGQKNYLSNVTGFYVTPNSTESLKWYYEVQRLILGYIFGAFYFIPNLAREYLSFLNV